MRGQTGRRATDRLPIATEPSTLAYRRRARSNVVDAVPSSSRQGHVACSSGYGHGAGTRRLHPLRAEDVGNGARSRSQSHGGGQRRRPGLLAVLRPACRGLRGRDGVGCGGSAPYDGRRGVRPRHRRPHDPRNERHSARAHDPQAIPAGACGPHKRLSPPANASSCSPTAASLASCPGLSTCRSWLASCAASSPPRSPWERPSPESDAGTHSRHCVGTTWLAVAR